MIGFFSYLIVPTVIFLTFVKLNNKRRWIVRSKTSYEYTYKCKDGSDIDPLLFYISVFVFFMLWWAIIPLIAIILVFSLVTHWLTNGEGIIPTDDKDYRTNEYYQKSLEYHRSWHYRNLRMYYCQ